MMYFRVELIDELLCVDDSALQSSLPVAPGGEVTVTIRTVGTLKLSDLPQASLLSPAKDGDQKPSSAVSMHSHDGWSALRF